MDIGVAKSYQLRYALYSIRKSPMALIGIFMIATVVAIAVFAPYLAPHPDQVYHVNIKIRLQPPSQEHPFGTDDHGRDILSRMIFGSRISLQVAMIVVSLATLMGTTLGLVSGYYGGMIDSVLMRITDAFLAFPPLVLALCIQAALGPSVSNTMLALSMVWWTWYARIVRGHVLGIKEELYKVKNYKGAGGLITFDEYGEVNKPMIVMTIQEEEFVKIS